MNVCIELCVPWKGIVVFPGYGITVLQVSLSRNGKPQFLDSYSSNGCCVGSILKKRNIKYMKAQMQLSALRRLNVRPCQRKLMFSVEKEQACISKKAS